MVLDTGKIAELGVPSELLKDKKGIFYSMAKDAGIIWTIYDVDAWLSEWNCFL